MSFERADRGSGDELEEPVGPGTADVEILEIRLGDGLGGKGFGPGGTVAGPVMMGVADAAIYVAILGELGIVALAVTTNLNINFLRKPVADADIIGECRLIKLGKRLAIGEVLLYSEGDDEPVAHAVGTYSIPPWA